MAIVEVTCIKHSLVLHRLESHELPIMIVTIFVLPICEYYICEIIYEMQRCLCPLCMSTPFLFDGFDHTSMLGHMWGMCALVGAIL
jgi:hypothetical protein